MAFQAERRYRPPFTESIGAIIGGGRHSEVSSLGSDWVEKEIKPFLGRPKDWERQLQGNIHLLETYLGPYVPSTSLVRGLGKVGEETLMVVQKRIPDARPLRDVTWSEIVANSNTVEQLHDLSNRIVGMYEAEGRTPDIHGQTTFNVRKQYNFKQTDSVMIDKDGNAWFTDVDMLGPLWSPNRWWGKIHMNGHMRSLRTFTEELIRRVEDIRA